MVKEAHIDALPLRVFANRFQDEKLGLVYYPSGLGRGGRRVSFDEANKFIDRYAALLARNKRWLSLSAKLMIASLPTSLIAGYALSIFAAVAILAVGAGLYFASLMNAALGPKIFELQVAHELNRHIVSTPLSRKERIERGFAWPFWKNILFYIVGGPLLIFVLLHRAGPHGLVALLGEDLAHDYEIALEFFMVSAFIVSLVAMPYLWWRKRRQDG